MFMPGTYITVQYMNAMLKLDKTTVDLQWRVLKTWVVKRKSLIVADDKHLEALVTTGYFVIDESAKTKDGFKAVMPYEYGEGSETGDTVQVSIDAVLLDTFVPGLIGLFTKITGISETLYNGKRNWGQYNIYWSKPIIEMINNAPGDDARDKANMVAEVMPSAIEAQRAKGYEIRTPQSILKFVIGALQRGTASNIVEVR